MDRDIEFNACLARLKILLQAREDLIEDTEKYSTRFYAKSVNVYRKIDLAFEDVIKYEAEFLLSLE
ncbi:hypothetical protein NYR90_11440 [Clostridioides difficile]|nr:hypothetical protein NYR90_11440 [Clostridioides difficile]